MGRPFTTLCCFLRSVFLAGLVLVLLLANFFASAFTCQCCLYAFFLAWFEVKGVALNLLNNVLLLHFALETPQSILEGFTLLQPNFRQTNTPPNPPSVGRNSYVNYCNESQEERDSNHTKRPFLRQFLGRKPKRGGSEPGNSRPSENQFQAQLNLARGEGRVGLKKILRG